MLAEDPLSTIHVDQIDNDLDGLIDENRPNHLNKATFINNAEQIVAVRHINYMNFNVGDTLQRGLIVPNRVIRERMASDASFNTLVTEYQDMLRTIYGATRSEEFYSTYYINQLLRANDR